LGSLLAEGETKESIEHVFHTGGCVKGKDCWIFSYEEQLMNNRETSIYIGVLWNFKKVLLQFIEKPHYLK
jgi:hypothetical protein